MGMKMKCLFGVFGKCFGFKLKNNIEELECLEAFGPDLEPEVELNEINEEVLEMEMIKKEKMDEMKLCENDTETSDFNKKLNFWKKVSGEKKLTSLKKEGIDLVKKCPVYIESFDEIEDFELTEAEKLLEIELFGEDLELNEAKKLLEIELFGEKKNVCEKIVKSSNFNFMLNFWKKALGEMK